MGEEYYLDELETLNQSYKMQIRQMQIDYEELRNRIDRAIEYIEIIQYNEEYGVKEKDYLNLLDILKGE